MGKNKVPWGPLAAMGVATALVGGGAYAAYDWTVSPPPTTTVTTLATTTTLSSAARAIDACNGLVEGYVDYATRILGPPPDGWVDDAKSSCVSDIVPRLEAGTSRFTDYCTGWQRGQEVARDTTGVALDFAACPPQGGPPPAKL